MDKLSMLRKQLHNKKIQPQLEEKHQSDNRLKKLEQMRNQLFGSTHKIEKKINKIQNQSIEENNSNIVQQIKQQTENQKQMNKINTNKQNNNHLQDLHQKQSQKISQQLQISPSFQKQDQLENQQQRQGQIFQQKYQKQIKNNIINSFISQHINEEIIGPRVTPIQLKKDVKQKKIILKQIFYLKQSLLTLNNLLKNCPDVPIDLQQKLHFLKQSLQKVIAIQ